MNVYKTFEAAKICWFERFHSSQICSIAVWALYLYKGFHGLGRHIEFISNPDQSKLSEASFWQVIISSCLGMALLKISIALNLLRLSPSRWYTWCLWVSIGKLYLDHVWIVEMSEKERLCWLMMENWQVSLQPTVLWERWPFSSIANPWKPSGTTLSRMPNVTQSSYLSLLHSWTLVYLTSIKQQVTMQLTVHGWSLQAFNIFTDVLFATLPVPIIWRLQMKTKIRLYLIGVLSLGYT